jgi:type II secretory pathway pseudopilin PulG
MKKMAKNIVLIGLLLTLSLTAGAQGHVRKAMERAKQEREAMARAQVITEQAQNGKGEYLRMTVENGDTTYYDKLSPLWIIGRKKGSTEKQWRDYYKLVYRFARVYPYAEAAGGIIQKADSVIAANNMGAVKKDRYIKDIQKQLFKSYESAFRQLTIYDGALMMKLIDRETGMSSYDIIKEYKNGVAAGFWQGVAKLFENDLKSTYDPNGADADTELLVKAWKAGEFRSLYWSVFWDYPPEVVISDINITY